MRRETPSARGHVFPGRSPQVRIRDREVSKANMLQASRGQRQEGPRRGRSQPSNPKAQARGSATSQQKFARHA